jgi:hypothetical protein
MGLRVLPSRPGELKRPHPEGAAPDGPAAGELACLAADALPGEIVGKRADGAKLQIARKDGAHRRGFVRDDLDLLAHGRIAERDRAP